MTFFVKNLMEKNPIITLGLTITIMVAGALTTISISKKQPTQRQGDLEKRGRLQRSITKRG